METTASPDGNSWITVARLLNGGPSIASLGISFARHGRYRTELYIDTGEQDKNKRIFDTLYAKKSDIQKALEGVSGSLEWERIDDKRASRIMVSPNVKTQNACN